MTVSRYCPHCGASMAQNITGSCGFCGSRPDFLLPIIQRLEYLEAKVFPVYKRHLGPRYSFANGSAACSHCGNNWAKGPFCAE